MEQFVLLLIIGAISLVNWILQKSAEHREKRKAERARGDSIHPTVDNYEPDPHPPFDPSEQTRKFLEALGLPEDALPPRPTPPPLPAESASAPVKRDFLHKIRPDLEQRLFGESSTSFEDAPVVVSRPRQVATAAAKVTVSPSSTARGLVTGLMSEKDGLRRAIVMREILGPPKALQT